VAYLYVKTGTHSGESFEVRPDSARVSIGRSPQCDIWLQDPCVSRHHADLIALAEGRFVVEDRGSTHGVLVSGERIQQAELSDRVELKLGTVACEFIAAEEKGIDRRNRLVFEKARDEETDEQTIVHTVVEKLDKWVRPEKSDDTPGAANELLQMNRRFRKACEISRIISSTFELETLYQEILRAIYSAVSADRASILLLDEKTREFDQHIFLQSRSQDEKVSFSSTIVKKVVENGESLLLTDAQGDAAFEPSQSILVQRIRSAMCVPLRSHEQTLGVINVDASTEGAFNYEDLELLTLLGNLAGTAIENVRLIEQSLQAARLAAVGTAVASLAHCIKNILQGLRAGAFMIDEAMKNDDTAMLQAAWPMVNSSQHRISELVLNMLDYSKERKPAYESADLRTHLQSLFDLMAVRAGEKSVGLKFDYHDKTPAVDCDPTSIYRAVLNLMTNAIDAADSKTGQVVLSARPSESFEMMTISVADNGSGIPPEMRGKLFETFCSTKASKGTGLGLAVTKKIIDEHHGTISIETSPETGTTFTIELPVRRPGDDETKS
jgi:two-component system, NtrC family, sensor kinase